MELILLAVIFRRAEEADMPGLMSIEEDCFGIERFRPEVVRAFLMRDRAFIVVCVEEGEIVGSAMAMYSEEVGEGKIASIAVLRRMRGQGIGAKLLEECENVFSAHDLKRYSLEVETSNEPAVSLYKTRGYRTVGIIDDFYGASRHAYCMQKRVGDSKGVKLTLS
jgi:ribosomal-protein-alanine N-acetyltransferase